MGGATPVFVEMGSVNAVSIRNDKNALDIHGHLESFVCLRMNSVERSHWSRKSLKEYDLQKASRFSPQAFSTLSMLAGDSPIVKGFLKNIREFFSSSRHFRMDHDR